MADTQQPGTSAPAPPAAQAVSMARGIPRSRAAELPSGRAARELAARGVAAYPRGLSRHVVRFARVGERVVAVKETTAHYTRRMRTAAEAAAHGNPLGGPGLVITDRCAPDGEPLPAALVTSHLSSR
ncbi:hypothetical protein QJS66_09340 [Kocuria rhizophila]|nr:hypothetical protein QJS66_09340 [Kocuria rhizophila]